MEEADILPDDEVRGAAEIARRAMALFGSVGLAFGAQREVTLQWLKSEGLWAELTPSELAFVTAKRPTKKQQIDASWQSEGLIVLLWALEKVERLPAPDEQCDTSVFRQHLPPFLQVTTSEYISAATRRCDEVLLDMADELLNLHWKARDARLHGRPMPSGVDIEIIQERHHAINWIIGYDGAPWDEVTTDT